MKIKKNNRPKELIKRRHKLLRDLILNEKMESLNLILDTYGLFSQKNCEKFDFSFEEYLPENYYKNISKEITVVLTTGTKMFYENNQTFIYFTAKDMDSKFCLSINSKFYSLTKSNFWKHFSFPILNEKK